jgi:hypothetical protein
MSKKIGHSIKTQRWADVESSQEEEDSEDQDISEEETKRSEIMTQLARDRKNKKKNAEPMSSPKEEIKDDTSTINNITDGNINNIVRKPGRPGKKKAGSKNPVGRPRKNPRKEPALRKGIVSAPSNEDFFMEFMYDQPMTFKKLSQFFKLMAVHKLQFLFREQDIIIYATDHAKKSKIRICIDCSKVNNYYCKTTFDIGMMNKDLEMLTNKIDRDYNDIILFSTHGNMQKNTSLVLNNDIHVYETHDIELIGSYDKMENESTFLDESHTIALNIPGRYLKKTINDIKTMSDQISIKQEDPDGQLLIEYITKNKKIRSTHYISNNNKINFTSKLKENESFRVDLKVDYIKPISASQLADYMIWYLDENKPTMFKAVIDEGAIEIKILTEIIDERNTN